MSTENPKRPDIEALEAALTTGTQEQWREGNCAGAVIVPLPDYESATDTERFYGGKVVFESADRPDREAIVALHNAAPDLFRYIRHLEDIIDHELGYEAKWKELRDEYDCLEARLAQLEAMQRRILQLSAELSNDPFPITMVAQVVRRLNEAAKLEKEQGE